jgi:orotate phosphoribosyltransferase
MIVSDLEELCRRINPIVVKRGTFTLRSGEISDRYLDIRELFGFPTLLNSICDSLYDKMQRKPDCVVGFGLGGVPLASIVASRHDIKLTAIRETQKNYGRQNQIEGYIPRIDDIVFVVDDVFTTGSSLNEATSVINQAGTKVTGYIVVVDRSKEVREGLQAPLKSLFEFDGTLRLSGNKLAHE